MLKVPYLKRTLFIRCASAGAGTGATALTISAYAHVYKCTCGQLHLLSLVAEAAGPSGTVGEKKRKSYSKVLGKTSRQLTAQYSK